MQRDLSSMPVCCLRQESLEEAIEETWLLCQEEKLEKIYNQEICFPNSSVTTISMDGEMSDQVRFLCPCTHLYACTYTSNGLM